MRKSKAQRDGRSRRGMREKAEFLFEQNVRLLQQEVSKCRKLGETELARRIESRVKELT